jgi:hypothetical protein
MIENDRELEHSRSFSIILHHSPSFFRSSRKGCHAFAFSPSFSIILHHSPSFSIILHHSPSFSIILHHSPSFSISLDHSPSFSIILRHSTSFSIILPVAAKWVPRFSISTYVLDHSHTARSQITRNPAVFAELPNTGAKAVGGIPWFSIIPAHARTSSILPTPCLPSL